MQKIKIYEVICKRCNESWPPRKKDIKRCPRCKSPYWNKERQAKKNVGKT